MNDSLLSGFLQDSGFGIGNNNNSFLDGGNGSDLFSIFDSFHHVTTATAAFPPPPTTTTHKSTSYCHGALETEPKTKRQKTASTTATEEVANPDEDGLFGGGSGRVSHITVERNRRKQMNGHLSLLRSLMPSFYVKRGDQASIIGGVVDYIKELQQVLQSLEAKKQRKAYTEGLLSPRLIPSPRPINLPPISPRTPQTPNSHITTSLLQQQHQMFTAASTSSNLLLHNNYYNSSTVEPSPTTSSSSSSNNIILNNVDNTINDLVAKSRSSVADVEVKFSGANLVVKTAYPSRFPGQVVRIISALEDMCLEILHVSINGVDDTMYNSFTIKIGVECQLSAEELAQQIQHTFC